MALSGGQKARVTLARALYRYFHSVLWLRIRIRIRIQSDPSLFAGSGVGVETSLKVGYGSEKNRSGSTTLFQSKNSFYPQSKIIDVEKETMEMSSLNI